MNNTPVGFVRFEGNKGGDPVVLAAEHIVSVSITDGHVSIETVGSIKWRWAVRGTFDEALERIAAAKHDYMTMRLMGVPSQ